MKYYVEIVCSIGDDEKVVERMGPMSERIAERVDRGVNININHEDYFTRIVEDESK